MLYLCTDLNCSYHCISFGWGTCRSCWGSLFLMLLLPCCRMKAGCQVLRLCMRNWSRPISTAHCLQVSDKALRGLPLINDHRLHSPPEPESLSGRSIGNCPARDGERIQADHTQEPAQTYGVMSLSITFYLCSVMLYSRPETELYIFARRTVVFDPCSIVQRVRSCATAAARRTDARTRTRGKDIVDGTG